VLIGRNEAGRDSYRGLKLNCGLLTYGLVHLPLVLFSYFPVSPSPSTPPDFDMNGEVRLFCGF